jgi:hypothetical protein
MSGDESGLVLVWDLWSSVALSRIHLSNPVMALVGAANELLVLAGHELRALSCNGTLIARTTVRTREVLFFYLLFFLSLFFLKVF